MPLQQSMRLLSAKPFWPVHGAEANRVKLPLGLIFPSFLIAYSRWKEFPFLVLHPLIRLISTPQTSRISGNGNKALWRWVIRKKRSLSRHNLFSLTPCAKDPHPSPPSRLLEVRIKHLTCHAAWQEQENMFKGALRREEKKRNPFSWQLQHMRTIRIEQGAGLEHFISIHS